MTKSNKPNIQVILPYEDLCRLYKAVEAAQTYQDELKRRDAQLAAIRGQLIEIMDCIREIRTELRSYHD